jgi:hypothetical protein
VSRNAARVDREDPLEAVDGELAGVPVAAHVVDKRVDARQPSKRVVGESTHVCSG